MSVRANLVQNLPDATYGCTGSSAVYAIAGWNDGLDAYTFKVTPLAFEVLRDAPGIRPAHYMASRGLKWVQVYKEPGLSDAALKDHIEASYAMICEKLTRKARSELGL